MLIVLLRNVTGIGPTQGARHKMPLVLAIKVSVGVAHEETIINIAAISVSNG